MSSTFFNRVAETSPREPRTLLGVEPVYAHFIVHLLAVIVAFRMI